MKFVLLVTVTFLIMSLARPLATNAEITISHMQYPPETGLHNPPATRANIELVTQAVYRLAGDPRLANHPIRAYLFDPQLRARIFFDSIITSHGAVAVTIADTINIQHNQDMAHYLDVLAHEFIHVAVADKYNPGLNYSFLRPEDFAFQLLVEEAFSNSIALWVRLSFPEMQSDRQIRNWENQSSLTAITDAMRNDYLVRHPNHSEDQINAMVAANMLNMYMTRAGTYSLQEVPRFLNSFYGHGSTFLITEYEAYRDRSDALLRHQWNYLFSMMPDAMQQVMRANNQTYDSYRNRFRSDIINWAAQAPSPEQSILYWVNYDYVFQGLLRMNSQRNEDRIYGWLSEETEQRLNRVMREIDPFFTPVDTSRNSQRVWEDQRFRGR